MALPFDNKIHPSSSSLGAAAPVAADISRMKGNLPPNVKQMLDAVMHDIMARPNVFGASVAERVSIVEASMVPKTEESTRTEARVVCEVTVTEGPWYEYYNYVAWLIFFCPFLDMLNPEGSLHGGCAAFLIDAYVYPLFCLSFFFFFPPPPSPSPRIPGYISFLFGAFFFARWD
jgi:hypothetical protein